MILLVIVRTTTPDLVLTAGVATLDRVTCLMVAEETSVNVGGLMMIMVSVRVGSCMRVRVAVSADFGVGMTGLAPVQFGATHLR